LPLKIRQDNLVKVAKYLEKRGVIKNEVMLNYVLRFNEERKIDLNHIKNKECIINMNVIELCN